MKQNYLSLLALGFTFLIAGSSWSCRASMVDVVPVPVVISEICAEAKTTDFLAGIVGSRVSGSVYYNNGGERGAENGLPLSGVAVLIYSGTRESAVVVSRVVTDESGHFSTESLVPGRYSLLTCLKGWNAISFSVEILRGEPEVEVVLEIGPS